MKWRKQFESSGFEGQEDISPLNAFGRPLYVRGAAGEWWALGLISSVLLAPEVCVEVPRPHRESDSINCRFTPSSTD